MTTSGIAISPFLLDMARDLESDLGAIANLLSLMNVSWGLTSLAAGAASDRVGRRPILIAAVLVLGGARIGLALAETYGAALLWQLLAGVGGGGYMGTVFATVSDQVPAPQRGRALGWVMVGQSLSLVLGVPLVTLLGAIGGWRGAIVTHGGVMVLTALLIWPLLPRPAGRRAGGGASLGSIARLMTPRVLALLGAGTMERACFAAMAVYLPTYLLTSYGVSLAELALALALVAIGNLVGNLAGGQVADRFPARPLAYAVSAVATGILALPLLAWQPALAVSVGLGGAYGMVNALGRPPLMAALSEVSSEARGAVLGLNVTTASMGWLGATAVGGWLVTRFGFGSLGGFCAVTALLGAALATASWRAGARWPGRP